MRGRCSDNFNHKRVIIRGHQYEFSRLTNYQFVIVFYSLKILFLDFPSLFKNSSRVFIFLILDFNWVLEHPSFNGHPWAIAYLHWLIAACDYKLDRMKSNFVKMKQEAQGYNITSDKLEFVRNTFKIMWWFWQENVDDFCRKILTIFLWKVDYVLQKDWTIFGRKFNGFCEVTIFVEKSDNLLGKFYHFCRKFWRFLQKNLTVFTGTFDIFQENLTTFSGKFDVF